jgi:hypothetical protein
MASSQARRAARTGQVIRGANFETKSQRKARRKRQVAAYLANRVVDAQLGVKDRAGFYRRLRQVKLRRRAIAKEMLRLSVYVDGLRREVGRVDDRGWLPGNPRLVDECQALTREAAAGVGVAAAEFEIFSRSRIYYGSGAAA